MGVVTTFAGDSPDHATRAVPEPPNDRPLVAALVVAFVLALECGTTYIASRLHYTSVLGDPLLVLAPIARRRLAACGVSLLGTALALLATRRAGRLCGGLTIAAIACALASRDAIYSPIALIRWQLTLGPATKHLLQQAWILSTVVAGALSLALIATWRSTRRESTPTTSHGSAHWADPALLVREHGIIVGRANDKVLRLDGEGHVLTVAPTRSGKGVSCVIPNLLDHAGSALVTDPKGENYAVTARWRRMAGHDVYALDPFELVGQRASYNPLDLVTIESPDAADDARMIADMLVLSEGKESGDQSFWNEEARGLLTGLILYAAASPRPEQRTLSEVRDLLTQPPDSFQAVLKAMGKSKAADGLVARASSRIMQKADRERSGVISTAQSHTHFLDSPRIKRVLSSSSFEFASLKRNPTTVYLVLPTDRIDSYSRWLRLMIACGLLAVTRTPGQPIDRVLFLLDEFAHLRRMHPVQRDIGLAGGYGVRFWLVLQDLSQLKSTYGDTWQTFLANTDLLQAFGTSDWDTAEYLSKMTGETTIRVASENRSSGVSRGRNAHRQQGVSLSLAETGRRLLFADEIRRLPRDRQLLFVKGTPPLLTARANYLADSPFSDRADLNPLYAPVGA